jgi:hypothetical protein
MHTRAYARTGFITQAPPYECVGEACLTCASRRASWRRYWQVEGADWRRGEQRTSKPLGPHASTQQAAAAPGAARHARRCGRAHPRTCTHTPAVGVCVHVRGCSVCGCARHTRVGWDRSRTWPARRRGPERRPEGDVRPPLPCLRCTISASERLARGAGAGSVATCAPRQPRICQATTLGAQAPRRRCLARALVGLQQPPSSGSATARTTAIQRIGDQGRASWTPQGLEEMAPLPLPSPRAWVVVRRARASTRAVGAGYSSLCGADGRHALKAPPFWAVFSFVCAFSVTISVPPFATLEQASVLPTLCGGSCMVMATALSNSQSKPQVWEKDGLLREKRVLLPCARVGPLHADPPSHRLSSCRPHHPQYL